MEKKTTQRIIGILVAIALVVILMPLVFSKNDLSTQTATIKAPPFPDQEQNSAQNETTLITPELAAKINGEPAAPSASAAGKVVVAQNDVSPSVTKLPEQSGEEALSKPDLSDASSSAPQPDVKLANSTAATSKDSTSKDSTTTTDSATPSVASATTEASSTVTPSSESPATTASASTTPSTTSTSSAVSSSVASSTPAATPASDDQADHLQTTASADEDVTDTSDKMPTTPTKEKVHKAIKSVASQESPSTHSSVSNAKQTSWVIQMGSFRDKTNARRLADKLRSAGYKAFMREIRSAHGSVQTRVFIGPETKQVAASQISSKIEQEMNMRGFVIQYKPLEL